MAKGMEFIAEIRQDDPLTGKRIWRQPNSIDLHSVDMALERMLALENQQQNALSTIPNELMPPKGTLGFRVQRYGIKKWGQLFSPRQLVSLTTLCRVIGDVESSIPEMLDFDFNLAIQTCLSQALDRLADFNSSLCILNSVGGRGVVRTFGRQALPMVWDFMETNPFNDVGANWIGGIEACLSTIKSESSIKNTGNAKLASASSHPLPNDCAQVVFTDPP